MGGIPRHIVPYISRIVTIHCQSLPILYRECWPLVLCADVFSLCSLLEGDLLQKKKWFVLAPKWERILYIIFFDFLCLEVHVICAPASNQLALSLCAFSYYLSAHFFSLFSSSACFAFTQCVWPSSVRGCLSLVYVVPFIC